MPNKKLFIKTWGCQMNSYDSTRMEDILRPLGYESSDTAQGADLVIFNTCHIREKATEKLFSELGRLHPLQEAKKSQGGRMMIAVAGCVAQAEGAEIARRAPFVDMIFGPQTYHQLPEMIAKTSHKSGVILNTEFPAESKFDNLPTETTSAISAFLSIQEGCDKFCTFCVVPYTRGAEYSRPVDAIMAEAKNLVTQGAIEITLLGQNVNAFHGMGADGTNWDLAKLLRSLSEIPQIKRLRYTTSHPSDMNDDLIAAHGDIPKLMPFLHLPVQSGSDTILQAMNRRHTIDDYKRTVDKLRKARTDIALSSDFIVGFPGESDADFENTLKLVRDIGFAQAYSFKYSPRPGTPAATQEGQISEQVKTTRLANLQTLIQNQQAKFNNLFIGQKIQVLFDRIGRYEGQIHGRSAFMQAVHVVGTAPLIGQEREVIIESIGNNSLQGRVV